MKKQKNVANHPNRVKKSFHFALLKKTVITPDVHLICSQTDTCQGTLCQIC